MLLFCPAKLLITYWKEGRSSKTNVDQEQKLNTSKIIGHLQNLVWAMKTEKREICTWELSHCEEFAPRQSEGQFQTSPDSDLTKKVKVSICCSETSVALLSEIIVNSEPCLAVEKCTACLRQCLTTFIGIYRLHMKQK